MKKKCSYESCLAYSLACKAFYYVHTFIFSVDADDSITKATNRFTWNATP